MNEDTRRPVATRRIGRFRIQDDYVRENWQELLPLFAQMVVVRCEHHFIGFFEYLAFSELFEETPEAIRPPRYEIQVKETVEGNEKRHEFSVKRL